VIPMMTVSALVRPTRTWSSSSTYTGKSDSVARWCKSCKHANLSLAARNPNSFKGTDVTFEQFPDRIKHLVQTTLPRVKVRSEVFPVYETKGDLVSPRSRRLEFRC
jgi:hypothetical protein